MPTLGVETFMLEVEQWAEEAGADTRLVVIGTINRINAHIWNNWPVLTGFSRGSWYAAINQQVVQGVAGNATAYSAQVVAEQIELGDVYVAGNVANYARRLEFGFVGTDKLGRNYNQTGRYIVRTALELAPRFAQEAAYVVAGQRGG